MERDKDFLASFSKVQEGMVSKCQEILSSSYFYNRGERLHDYSLEEVDRIINSGSFSSRLDLSRNYFYKDGFYNRILIYYATLLTYSGMLVPMAAPNKNLSDPSIAKRYYKALDYIENLSLADLFTRIALTVLIDGAYFGIIQTQTKDEFTILDLPSKYCTSRFKDFYNRDVIDFDVRYFNTLLDKDIRRDTLLVYPDYIANHYKLYEKGKVSTPFVRIPTEVGVFFSFNDGVMPLFISTIPRTIEFDEGLDIDREKELEEIRKIIVQHIPHLNDGSLLFEPVEAQSMHSGTVGMLKGNKNLSVLTTYGDVDAIISKTAADTSNVYSNNVRHNIYAESAVSSEIFSPTGSMSVSTSINNDIALMMILGNRFGALVTRIVNSLFGNQNIYFKYLLLPVSIYNRSDYITDAFKLAQSGYSFLLPSIAMGISQRELMGIKDLENNLLKLPEILIPLSSSYTQSSSSSSDGGGRPELPLEKKSMKTIQNEQSIDRQGGSE